jgi:hypothetical protein
MTNPSSETIPFHPLADLFPLMQGAEFDTLVEDIRANGLNEPIRLFDGQVLDGRNRYRAMLKLEPNFAPSTFPGDFDDFDNLGRQDALAFVISANIHRRHLTTDQKRDLIAKLLKANPEKSDRSIAKVAKVSHVTVAKARKDAEATGQTVQLKQRIGGDGKARKQPATKQAQQSPVLDVQPRAAKPTEAGEDVTASELEAAFAAKQRDIDIDGLAALQCAWDATPQSMRQQFAEANAVELRQILEIVAKKARDIAADRAFARSQATSPASTLEYPDLPAFCDRSIKAIH